MAPAWPDAAVSACVRAIQIGSSICGAPPPRAARLHPPICPSPQLWPRHSEGSASIFEAALCGWHGRGSAPGKRWARCQSQAGDAPQADRKSCADEPAHLTLVAPSSTVPWPIAHWRQNRPRTPKAARGPMQPRARRPVAQRLEERSSRATHPPQAALAIAPDRAQHRRAARRSGGEPTKKRKQRDRPARADAIAIASGMQRHEVTVASWTASALEQAR